MARTKTYTLNYWTAGFLVEKLARLLLAGVMLASGIPKLFSIASFGEIINAYGLIPEALTMPAALLLVVLEIAAAVLLVLSKRAGLWLVALLMALFIAVLSYGIWLGLDIDCGCFAPGDAEHKAFSGLRSALWRDLFLSIPIIYCLWYGYRFPKT